MQQPNSLVEKMVNVLPAPTLRPREERVGLMRRTSLGTDPAVRERTCPVCGATLRRGNTAGYCGRGCRVAFKAMQA